MDSSKHLRIGVPSKGRLSEIAGDLLGQAGLNYRRQNRGLFARVSGLPIDMIFLRTDDIPTLCAEGAIDMGVTGSDLVEEAGLNPAGGQQASDDKQNSNAGGHRPAVTTRMKLGVGRCRLAICVPDDSSLGSAADLDGKRIATSFPTVTANYLSQHRASAHLVRLSGSVEVMIGLGIADAIVDLVETGSTLAANRLKVLEEIGTYETVLIQGRGCRDDETANRVVRRLEGVVIARDYSLLEYNIPRSVLSQAEAITPGFHSPTVNTLEDRQWCSIRVMVRRNQVISVMEQLETLGASAIMETSITNCRL